MTTAENSALRWRPVASHSDPTGPDGFSRRPPAQLQSDTPRRVDATDDQRCETDAERGLPVVLYDGTTVDIVPMSPEDAARLVRFHHTLSAETTYLRYFSVHPELNDHEVYRFTHVDHRDREALVAVVDGQIVR